MRIQHYKFLIVIWLCFFGLGQNALQAQTHASKVALIIGNTEYTNLPRLKNASKDAFAVAQALSDKGFTVFFIHDVNTQDLRDSLTFVSRRAAHAKQIFIYWAMQLTPAPTRYSILSHGALSCKYDRSYGYVHAPVTHAASISGDATPLTHRVASLLKRWWLGTHQGAISPEHLAYYLDEFTFRFNRRTSRSRGKLFYRLIEQALQINPVPAKTIIHNI